ncbi:methylated-DNA--[protein]-cysteine S-methyltransferase [Alkalibaculum sp. M08DMB]|uniref:Methylated-DNA--protein-cysteine methyltransferase n=1 Tax=Alkalibaculum sporogenes TaxID=2655001 RepID=A0A6A7K6N8_9FIRM|nr:methylated-DNA--[protein]-cysteine S-methyltransferase [Alkalibaculum sporogenes]MPW25100.1 methylated-DNA--[protein]-cysteine S-methyltransferase [Alkalibaculum sporogenes]
MNYGYYYETLVGKIVIVENGSAITHLCYGDILLEGLNIIETPLLKKANLQIQEYLSGKRKVFDLIINPQGTEFQKKVWKALQEIPYGNTCSYKEIAKTISNEKAYRAVGMANNKNPIAIFNPCHRVIGASGKLVGYAGGLNVKQVLLELERRNS